MKKESKFVLGKDTVISCLFLLVKTGFYSYDGNKPFLQDAQNNFKEEHYRKIEKADWLYIATPWKQVKLVMDSYYEILGQTPKDWFTENTD